MVTSVTPTPKTMDEQVAELRQRRTQIELAEEYSGSPSIMPTARDRIEGLVDHGSFQEIGAFIRHHCTMFGMEQKDLPADGVVTGCATVDGRLVHLASQDFTVSGGSAGEVQCGKIVEMMRQSMKTGSPFIFINDSGGARVQEGIGSLAGYARVFYNNVMLSGSVPQISIICGPCAGGAAYSPRRVRPGGRGDRAGQHAAIPGDCPSGASHQTGASPAEETWTHPALGTGDFVIMLFELAQRSVVSAAVHARRDAAASDDTPQKTAIPVVVRIAKRGGGEVPPKHAAVIAMAATVAMVQKRPAPSPAASLRRKNAGSWVLQGRTLIHASHNVAHRPMQSRFAGIAAEGREPKNISEGSAE